MRGNITHQGTVTTSVSYSQEEFKRRRNAGKGGAGTVYPGGADTNNLRVARNDLIMGWKKATLGTHMPGRPQECGWSSFNGIDLQDYNGDPEELADDIYFIGVSRTDYNPTDPLAPQNGLAVIRKGTVDPFYTGKADVFPGDDMIWSAPRLDDVWFFLKIFLVFFVV